MLDLAEGRAARVEHHEVVRAAARDVEPVARVARATPIGLDRLIGAAAPNEKRNCSLESNLKTFAVPALAA